MGKDGACSDPFVRFLLLRTAASISWRFIVKAITKVYIILVALLLLRTAIFSEELIYSGSLKIYFSS